MRECSEVDTKDMAGLSFNNEFMELYEQPV
jgi:hypothetical protein